MNFLFVALGGAVGAMARYAISLIPLKTEFPFLTLITNVIGAILIGFIVGITSARDGVSKNMVLFWKTGVCGGFTTFSTFSLESYNLFEHNHCLLGGRICVVELFRMYIRCDVWRKTCCNNQVTSIVRFCKCVWCDSE